MRKLLCIILLSCIHLVVHAQTLEELGIDLSRLPQKTYAESMRYWFDDDIGTSANGIGLMEMHNVDASSLKDGIHILHLQIADNEGIWGIPYSSVFMKTSIAEMAPVKELRYWFNDDRSIQKTGNASGSILSVDASRLPDGVHTFHCQVIDELGISSHIMSSIFLKVEAAVNFSAKKLRYWFDDDHALITNIQETGGMLSIDASILQDGVHTFHCQVIDGTGISSHIASSIFVKAGSGANLSAKKLLYWFDDDATFSEFDMSGGLQTLDASMLLEGLHTLHYQIICSDGTLTSAHSALFMRMNVDEQTAKVSKLRYWYDDNHDATEISATNGVQMLDASGLLQGLHTFHYQTVDVTGALGTPMSSLFMKVDSDVNVTSIKKQRYWFDDDIATLHESDIASGTQTLDASGLGAGLHILHYQQIDDAGNVSVPYNALFMKMAESSYAGKENVITKYMYWTNDLSANNVKVNIDTPTKSFSLISLLPVVKAPIRSSNFQFEVRNGKPMMFAKNDIHVRFCDSYGYWVDDSRSFLDYSVMHEITNIANLQTTQTFTRTEENGINWFKFEAEYGDSIALRSNQASSIQIFNASGKELYSVSGSNSVNFGGCHVFEDGTFYVAVHDVTGSAQNVTLESKKIEKFCIFEYSPDRITSEGNVIMSFSGNGLEYVKSVRLTDGDITIAADTMIARSSEMMAAFRLNEDIASDRKLSLEVYFNNEEKNDSKTVILKDAVTLEPVKAGNINVTITRENRVGDPYPIQIHIKNTGNLAYTAIPFGLAFDNVDKFDGCTFENFELLLSEERYIERDFFAYTDNLLGQGKKGLYIPMILPYLGPYEELVYTVGIKTKIPHANINAYAWAIEPWSESLKKYNSKSYGSNVPRKALDCTPTNLPQIHDLLDALSDFADALDLPTAPFDLAKIGIGAGEAIGGMQQGLTRAREDAVFDAYGFDPEMLGMSRDDFRMQFRYCPRSPQDIAASFSPIDLPNRQPASRKAPRGNSTNSMASGDCPHVNPTPVNPWIPGDPNEITGYLSESGSHYINTEVVNVGYDIEFENDPEIANAAAHHIVIRDTLDARFFDFDSFVPKTVKISGKEVELDGTYPFVKSLDMRPEINSIAELRGDFDKKTGIATWDLIALDPMTMEPTDDIMQGILPVNTQDGNGIGNVTYTINLKPNLGDGTEIPNRAGIIFDYNDAIMTPVWTNIIDAVAPESSVIDVTQQGDSAIITCEGTDERSGIWKYEVYAQPGINAPWIKVGECFADSATISYEVFADIDYGFCALAVDSAGNVEKKELEREFSLNPILYGDVNGDGSITISDAVGIVNFVIHANTSSLNEAAADANEDGEVTITDAVFVVNRVIHSNQKNKNLYEKETNYRVTGTRRHANAQ